MKATFSFLLFLILAVALAACTPTIDASDDEAFEASVEKVRDSLDSADQDSFDEALEILVFSTIGEAFLNPDATGDELADQLLASLDGKTGREVIEEAQRVQQEVAREEARREQERIERERRQALAEIEELEERQAAAEEARQQLENFEVRRSRFELIRERYMGASPSIKLEVYNGTEHAVSRAYFEGTLATPGRSVPWLQETFNYNISGGLEPGESAEWDLRPNRFSDWGNVEDREDMVFTVVTTRLDGPDGEPLFRDNFTERDERRLATLREEYTD